MSLFAFCEDPAAAAVDLLPPLSARKSRIEHGYPSPGAWPVDLLPAEALAADVARVGVAYRQGVGYLYEGQRVEADDVAYLAATVLEAAADVLPWSPREAAAERLRVASEQLRIAEANTLARLNDVVDWDALPADAARESHVWSTRTMRRLVAQAREDLGALPADVPGARSWRSYSFALEATAAELRASSSARRRLLDAVRPFLPAPAVAPVDANALDAFLAQFDGADVVRRSRLSALYAEAGRPGGLSSADLRAAGDARWGAARKSAGHHVWRPARSRRSLASPVGAPA